MRTSQYLLATEKETPANAELASHRLMLRAGLIRKLASGIYTWLPTGLRVVKKATAIIEQEMNNIGACQVLMPNVLPAELVKESGRWDKFGRDLLTIQDRHDRDFCFGPTHEEVVTDLARRELRSYKQLPLTLYQVQTKFRDEIRPRFGLMRGREFIMKDAYSFHLDEDSLTESYNKMSEAYSRILQRLGLSARKVWADPGAIGGDISHEFQVLAQSGEDLICYSDASDYAANIERASALAPQHDRGEPGQELTKFATPDSQTIDELCAQHSIAASTTVKTLLVKNAADEFVALVLRGDHELNEVKASNLAIMQGHMQMATKQEVRQLMGAGVGSIGPVNCSVEIVVDRDASVLSDFVCGANEDGYHLQGVNWERDIANFQVADLRNVIAGDLSPDGKGCLQLTRGIEVGHIFQLKDHYSAKMGATVLGPNGKPQPLLMGCYGLGVSRLIAAAIEQHHDSKGIVWPEALAPFKLAIVPIGYQQNSQVAEAADSLYHKLSDLGIEVLLDDRDERPGTRFADMDLLGIPHRVVISSKTLHNACIEYKSRHAAEPESLSFDGLMERLAHR